MNYSQCRKELEKKMDEFQTFRDSLKTFYEKEGFVPEEYEYAWSLWESEGFSHWRDVPGIEKKIHKAAKRATKNGAIT